jgi:uncharacterized protein YqeY
MTLRERLVSEMKNALKGREKTRLSTIRLIHDGIKKKEIELGRKELDDSGIIQVISGMVRRGEDAIEQFKRGGRQDLVDEESRQVEVLKSFLPQQLSAEEIRSLIEEAIREVQAVTKKDLGKVMKVLMPRIAGRADGRAASELAKERLSG